jgi:uncharacterized Zn-binding protein involved in type VI secretion
MPGKAVQRVGDLNTGGGVALGPGHNNVKINGRPALKPNTPFTPHWGCDPRKPIHCIGVVAVSGNSKTVRANGEPLVISGAKDSCRSHSRAMGSPDVRAV